MLIIENHPHFDEVREFARSVGADGELQKRLDFLANFGGDAAKVRCRLYSDFAPHSFFWRMEYSSLDGWKNRACRRTDLLRPRRTERWLRHVLQRQPEPRCGGRPEAYVVHPHLSQRGSLH